MAGGVVLLDTVDEDHGLAGLTEAVVDGAHGLEVFGVGFQLRTDRQRDLLRLRKGLLVPAGAVKDGEHALPGVDAIRVIGEDLAGDGKGALGKVSRKIHARELHFERDGGLLVGRGLLRDGVLQDLLRNFGLVALLVDRSNGGLEADVAHGRFVDRLRHTLQGLHSLGILLQSVLDADHALPRGAVVGIGGEDLAIQAVGLIEVVGCLEQAGVLQLRPDLEGGGVGRKRELQRGLQDLLGFGVPPDGGVGGGEGAQEVGIAHELGENRGRNAMLGEQRLGRTAGAELGENKPAPGRGRGRLHLGEVVVDVNGCLGLLGLEQGAAQAFEGFGAGGTQGERGLVALLRGR